jgi:hypothetical protein
LTRGRIYDLVLHLQNDKEAIVHGQDALRPRLLV